MRRQFEIVGIEWTDDSHMFFDTVNNPDLPMWIVRAYKRKIKVYGFQERRNALHS
jgi:hypothetical protein